MLTVFHNRKGQAAAELAILGTLILVAFSYVMNFGQTLLATEQVKMETFRRALQKAYITNSSVDYSLKRNLRAASVNAGFFQGQGLSPQSSSSVMWQKGQSGPPGTTDTGGFSYWQVNDTMPAGQDEYGLPRSEKMVVNLDGSEQYLLVPSSIYKENLNRSEGYNLSVIKNENASGISYNKSASMVDSTVGTGYAHYDTKVDEDPWDDDRPTPEYSSATAHDYAVSDSYQYDKSWSVNHD